MNFKLKVLQIFLAFRTTIIFKHCLAKIATFEITLSHFIKTKAFYVSSGITNTIT